jgi:20S proteasome alpha/beta subunit
MTIVVGVPCSQAVIFASDTEVSDQRTRTTDIKIKQLNDRCLWAGAGYVSVIQQLEERLALLPDRDRPLHELREPIGLAVKATLEDMLRIDYRVPYLQNDLPKLGALYHSDFIFAEYRDGKGHLLSLDATGAPEWFTHPHAIGSAADFAVALTKNYDRAALTPEQAALLVIATLEQAIETAQSGVDYPLDIWRLDEAGAHHYDDAELSRLYAEADRLRGSQREILEHWRFHDGQVASKVRGRSRDPRRR